MLDVTYDTLKNVDGTWKITHRLDPEQPYYIGPHFFFQHAMLNRRDLRLSELEDTLAAGRPFIFPLELRWDFLNWFGRDNSPQFLTPFVPAAVLDAARRGRAIILVFYAHEAMSMHRNIAGRDFSTYDLLFDFVTRHRLPSESVWLLSGDLCLTDDFRKCKERRFPCVTADLFQVRGIDIFMYAIQAFRRLREEGLDLVEGWAFNDQGRELYKSWKYQPCPVPLGELYNDPAADAQIPTKLFLCMNRCPKEHRRYTVVYLYMCGLLERSLVSFRDENPSRTNFGNNPYQKAWENLQKLLPLNIDRNLSLTRDAFADTNLYTAFGGPAWPYRDTFFSIVTETMFDKNAPPKPGPIFLTEKTWKPSLNGPPFIIVGQAGTLAYLRSLGFRTFHPIIDETYDAVLDPGERLTAIFKSIHLLAGLSPEQLREVRAKLQPVTEHNTRLLRSAVTPMERLVQEWMEILSEKLSGNAVALSA